MGHFDDLKYTPDGLRDTMSELGDDVDEQHITSSMLAEVAVAQHRTAEAIEEQNKLLKEIANNTA